MIEVAVIKSSSRRPRQGSEGKGGPPRSGEESLIPSVSGAAENIRRTVAPWGGELSDKRERSFLFNCGVMTGHDPQLIAS